MSLSFKQLFSILVIAMCALLAASVLFAWTGPTATPPNGNVAAPINVGTTDQVKNAGLSVNALGVFGSEYIQNKLGINRVSPITALDVNGSIKIGSGNEACQTVTEGAFRYNTTTHAPEYCDGTAWKALASASGSSTAPTLHRQVFTSSGTFTAPADATASTVYKVTAVGGGGAGTQSADGGTLGGAGGATCIKWVSGIQPSATVSVTVGAGGAGPATYSGVPGNGAPSNFGAYCSAGGGGGAYVLNGGSDYPGVGGVSTGGDINIQGQSGNYNFAGSSTMGAGGTGLSADPYSSGNRVAASGYGGGGLVTTAGGGIWGGGTVSGPGTAGIVIVEWVQ